MSPHQRAWLFATVAATACATGGEDVSGLEARVAALEAENEALREDLDDALTAADLAGYVQTAALEAYATDADLALCALDSDLAAYALTTDLDDYALTTDLDDYALTTDLDDYALTTDLDDYALASDAVTVMGTTTLNVPSQYPTIQAALSSLAAKRLTGPVTIQVAPDTYALSSKILVSHPDCRYITIRGAPSAPGTVTLNASATGVEVDGCQGLTIEGFTVDGTGAESGVLVGQGAHVILKDLVISEFYYGIYADAGSFVEASNTDAQDSYVGVVARGNSHVALYDGSVTGNAIGLFAHTSSAIEANYVDISNTTDATPSPFILDYEDGSSVFRKTL